MQVLRARSAGFCIGVSLALRRLDEELAAFTAGRVLPEAEKRGPARLITFGPIIHNPLVMQSYATRGVVCESDPAVIRPGDRVVIRAHGVPRMLERRLESVGASIVDATCPKVKKAQLAIMKEHDRHGVLLLFGEKEHPEVQGLLSYAGDDALVFGDLEELERLSLSADKPYFLAAQTTQERSLFLRAREHLEKRLGRRIRALDTICDATRDRQREALELAGQVQAMVVVGGLNSGNTRRLAEVARARGVPTMHVEQVSDITPQMRERVLKGAVLVGLTAGASTPQEHIDAVQAYLEKPESANF